MSTAIPAAPTDGNEDHEPLLSGEGNFLRRVVSGLQPKRTLRRWFTAHQPAGQGTDGTSQHQAASHDIESGTLPVASAAAEAAAARVSSVDGTLAHVQSFSLARQETAGSSAAVRSPMLPGGPAPSTTENQEVPASEHGESAPSSPRQIPVEHSSSSGTTGSGLVATLGQLFGFSSSTRRDQSGDCETGDSEAARHAVAGRALLQGLSRSDSGSLPMCLICLEPFTTDDFMSGEALSLECQCRGEMALRHRTCAIKWSRVKGDVTCDVCKTQVQNLPTPTPRSASPTASDADAASDEFTESHVHTLGIEGIPGHADLMFDCIRVTWVAMIVCILFFEMNLTTALWSGIAAGLGYTMFVRAMVRNQLAAAAVVAADSNRASSGSSSNVAPVVLPPPMLHHVIT